jgi:hypothetical protein
LHIDPDDRDPAIGLFVDLLELYEYVAGEVAVRAGVREQEQQGGLAPEVGEAEGTAAELGRLPRRRQFPGVSVVL